MVAQYSLKQTEGPTYTIPPKVLDLVRRHDENGSYMDGEILSFPYLEPKFGFELIEGKSMVMPSYRERDEDVYGDLDAQFLMTIHVETKEYELDSQRKSATLETKISEWILGDFNEHKMKILNVNIDETTETHHQLSVIIILDAYRLSDSIGEVLESPFLDQIFNTEMESIIEEGVCYVHGDVPATLCSDLRKHIDNLAKNSAIDYHPNSNDVVRDLVHPALYPYIKGISALNKPEEQIDSPDGAHDFWGRNYEDSKFQWLPTTFSITKEGKCTVQDYINNLDRMRFPDMYTDVEKLFEVFLPYFEEVWSYANTVKLYRQTRDDSNYIDEITETPPFEKEAVNFKDSQLQVIVKIVDYILQPGQAYEGVWHCEGMSHENIVMTGLYFLDRAKEISGGDLRFKRAFTKIERNMIFCNIIQCRPVTVNNFAQEGFIPLGKFPTEEGYLLVFPNSHIHKLSKLVNNSAEKVASRRMIAFFVINPTTNIISTKDVPAQQSVISLSDAKRYRLELMAERKYDKEKLNVRDIELCEH